MRGRPAIGLAGRSMVVPAPNGPMLTLRTGFHLQPFCPCWPRWRFILLPAFCCIYIAGVLSELGNPRGRPEWLKSIDREIGIAHVCGSPFVHSPPVGRRVSVLLPPPNHFCPVARALSATGAPPLAFYDTSTSSSGADGMGIVSPRDKSCIIWFCGSSVLALC